MKALLSIILVLALISTSAMCEQIDDVNDSLVPTTSIIIRFLGNNWGCDRIGAESVVKNAFPEINTINEYHLPGKTETSESSVSWNYHDLKYIYFPYLESENAKTTIVTFENTKQFPGGGRSNIYSASIGDVAGHPVDKVKLRFLENDNYGLFDASYSFITSYNRKIPTKDRYNDLKSKVSKKYGIPYVYEIQEESRSHYMSGRNGECAVWVGEEGSAVCLYYYEYIDGYLSGIETLCLDFGTTECNSIFENADDVAKAEEENRIRSEIDSISDADYGL